MRGKINKVSITSETISNLIKSRSNYGSTDIDIYHKPIISKIHFTKSDIICNDIQKRIMLFLPY